MDQYESLLNLFCIRSFLISLKGAENAIVCSKEIFTETKKVFMQNQLCCTPGTDGIICLQQ